MTNLLEEALKQNTYEKYSRLGEVATSISNEKQNLANIKIISPPLLSELKVKPISEKIPVMSDSSVKAFKNLLASDLSTITGAIKSISTKVLNICVKDASLNYYKEKEKAFIAYLQTQYTTTFLKFNFPTDSDKWFDQTLNYNKNNNANLMPIEYFEFMFKIDYFEKVFPTSIKKLVLLKINNDQTLYRKLISNDFKKISSLYWQTYYEYLEIVFYDYPNVLDNVIKNRVKTLKDERVIIEKAENTYNKIIEDTRIKNADKMLNAIYSKILDSGKNKCFPDLSNDQSDLILKPLLDLVLKSYDKYGKTTIIDFDFKNEIPDVLLSLKKFAIAQQDKRPPSIFFEEWFNTKKDLIYPNVVLLMVSAYQRLNIKEYPFSELCNLMVKNIDLICYKGQPKLKQACLNQYTHLYSAKQKALDFEKNILNSLIDAKLEQVEVAQNPELKQTNKFAYIVNRKSGGTEQPEAYKYDKEKDRAKFEAEIKNQFMAEAEQLKKEFELVTISLDGSTKDYTTGLPYEFYKTDIDYIMKHQTVKWSPPMPNATAYRNAILKAYVRNNLYGFTLNDAHYKSYRSNKAALTTTFAQVLRAMVNTEKKNMGPWIYERNNVYNEIVRLQKEEHEKTIAIIKEEDDKAMTEKANQNQINVDDLRYATEHGFPVNYMISNSVQYHYRFLSTETMASERRSFPVDKIFRAMLDLKKEGKADWQLQSDHVYHKLMGRPLKKPEPVYG